MYSQAYVRAGKVLRHSIRALPSVIVVTEKVMWEAHGARWKSGVDCCPVVRLESRTGEPVRSPKIISGDKRLSRLVSYIHHT